MTAEGPPLEALLRRLIECPPEFLLPPGGRGAERIDLDAIVADHFRALVGAPPPRLRLADPARHAAQATLTAVATWLLHDPWFLARPDLAERTQALLETGLAPLAKVVAPADCVRDPDRREELVRRCLRALGLRPAGETEARAADRLATLDSVERVRVVEATRAAEARAREIRERMAREAAQAAAARYSPE